MTTTLTMQREYETHPYTLYASQWRWLCIAPGQRFKLAVAAETQRVVRYGSAVADEIACVRGTDTGQGWCRGDRGADAAQPLHPRRPSITPPCCCTAPPKHCPCLTSQCQKCIHSPLLFPLCAAPAAAPPLHHPMTPNIKYAPEPPSISPSPDIYTDRDYIS